jgi:hypothetical protein
MVRRVCFSGTQRLRRKRQKRNNLIANYCPRSTSRTHAEVVELRCVPPQHRSMTRRRPAIRAGRASRTCWLPSMPAVAVAPRSRSGRPVRGEAATGAKGPVPATLARVAASGRVLGHVRDKHRQARSRTRWSRTRDPARQCTLTSMLSSQRTRSTTVYSERKKAMNKNRGKLPGRE